MKKQPITKPSQSRAGLEPEPKIPNKVPYNKDIELETNNFFSIISFSWINKIVDQGSKYPYQIRMLFKGDKQYTWAHEKQGITEYMHSVLLKPRNEKKAKSVQNHQKPEIYKDTQIEMKNGSSQLQQNESPYPESAYFNAFNMWYYCRRFLTKGGLFFFLQETLLLGIPILFKLLVEWLNDDEATDWHGYLYLGIMVLLLTVKLIFGRLAVVNLCRGDVLLKNIVQVSYQTPQFRDLTFLGYDCSKSC